MELLSPAGDREALVAAIQNGADAVYLGGLLLNARRGAGNFDADGLLWACEYCHERGAKVYITVNTLIKQEEMGALAALAEQIARAGCDAAIVQDLGVAMALQKMLPGLELHASTQMAVHNRQGVDFLKKIGITRCVLAREMSFAEIAQCRGRGVDLEAFGHGALCVSCSGQCWFSSLVGGRSGNRGMCAQPCRLPYSLEGKAARASGYLLSPKDLCMLGQLGELRAAGVDCIKLEGRLKRAEYVAVVTKIYRRALDGASVPEAMEELKQIFNRGGFTKGYGPGLADRDLLCPDRPSHMGVALGTVKGGRVRLAKDVALADDLLIGETPIKLAGAAGEWVAVRGAKDGETLLRLNEDRQLRLARASYAGEAPRVSITGRLTAQIGEPPRLRVGDGTREAEARGEGPVERARGGAADASRIAAQLQKTGGTPYAFTAIDLDVAAEAYLSAATLNALRRTALARLGEARIEAARGCEKEIVPYAPPVFTEAASASAAIPGRRDAIPCASTAIPGECDDKTTIPCASATMPGGRDAVPCASATIPGGRDAVPCASATIPDEHNIDKTTVPCANAAISGEHNIDKTTVPCASATIPGGRDAVPCASATIPGECDDKTIVPCASAAIPGECNDKTIVPGASAAMPHDCDDKTTALCASATIPGARDDKTTAPGAQKFARRAEARPLLCAQASDFALLRVAREAGADECIWEPLDVTKAGLEAAPIAEKFTIAPPMTLNGDDLETLRAWVYAHRENVGAVLAGNVAHLTLDWGAPLRADFSLQVGNDETVALLNRLGIDCCVPSVEWTAGEIRALRGEKELIVYGRLPLMQLRHCPLGARLGGARHADCRHCDTAPADKRLCAHKLVDRKDVSFPLGRLKTASGCIVRIYNSVPLMLIRHWQRLPEAARYRMIFTDETPAQIAALTRVYRAATDGRDPRAEADWPAIDRLPATTGHYFRGVE